MSILGNPLPSVDLLSITQLFVVWRKYVIGNRWLFLPRDVLPLSTLHALIPNFSSTPWTHRGLTNLEQFFCNNIFRPLTDLPADPPIPYNLFFQYLQIRHTLQNSTWPKKTPLSKFFLGTSGLRKGMSVLYSILADSHVDNTPPHISRWGSEFSCTFPSEVWEQAATIPLKFSKCITHLELMHKIHLIWYLTSKRLAHMSSTSSPMCWRQCGQVGSLLHMWWSCPGISPFWSVVSTLITDILGLPLTLSPELAILDMDLQAIPSHFKTYLKCQTIYRQKLENPSHAFPYGAHKENTFLLPQ